MWVFVMVEGIMCVWLCQVQRPRVPYVCPVLWNEMMCCQMGGAGVGVVKPACGAS